MLSFKDRLKEVTSRIAAAACACGRDPAEVGLVAVSKTKSVAQVEEAIVAGVTTLGENYVQEAREKYEALCHHPVGWHFIGHLQSNKAKYVVRMFDLIHAIDSVKLALEVDRQAQKAAKRQRILMQVNVSGETSKYGLDPDSVISVLREISTFEHIAIEGLMTMPPFFDAPDRARPYFKALRKLRDRIRDEHMDNIKMDTLSMGMTGDYSAAIAEGATLVRIGTAIFGARS
jgi:PLP dependent protein